MKKIKMLEPEVGRHYRTSDSKEFVITGLPILNKDNWVEYTDIQNKKDYYCRLEAFLARFSPISD